MDGLIKGYPVGSDITLLDTIYLRPRKHGDDEHAKWDDGSITIIFKDNVEGVKKCITYDNPDYKFYTITNHEDSEPYNRLFVEKEKLTEHKTPFTNLEAEIAKLTNNMEFYKAYKYQDRQELKKLHYHPDVFNSDSHIEDQYRARFAQDYTNRIVPITKAYLDIEADTTHMKGDFPEPGECPINAVTVVFDHVKQVYTFLLRDKTNPKVAEFEEFVKHNNINNELKEFIKEAVGGWKEEIRFGISEYNYNFAFFDEADEIFMIAELFRIINTIQPDFLMAWNMGFDVPYIIQRIINLGYDPSSIMCHKDFKYPIVRYYIDERNKNDYAERGDFATISSYTVYLDQMIHFASRRKGQSAFTSFSLDFIGEMVAKVRKIDYSSITTNLAELPRKNYKLFYFYNVMDTIVQKCIECKTQDLEYIFGKCNINNTRYSKCHRQTVYLANRASKEFEANGFIIGNNVNKLNQKAGKFPGAFVADPTKLNDYSKMSIAGHYIQLLRNTVDFDYASLYPSLLREFNMAPNTQLGMVKIDYPIWDGENRRHETEKYTRGGEYIENLQSRVYLEFCKRWLHLGSFMEVYNDVIEYFTIVKNPTFYLQTILPNGMIKPFIKRDNTDMIKPFIIKEKNSIMVPFEVFNIKSNEQNNKIREVINNARECPKQSFLY